MRFLLLVDGVPVELPAPCNDLKVIVVGHPVDDQAPMEVHQAFTFEGIVTDIIDPSEAPEAVIASSEITYTELVETYLNESDQDL